MNRTIVDLENKTLAKQITERVMRAVKNRGYRKKDLTAVEQAQKKIMKATRHMLYLSKRKEFSENLSENFMSFRRFGSSVIRVIKKVFPCLAIKRKQTETHIHPR